MPELITDDEIRRYDSLWKKQREWAGGAEERRSFEEIIEDPKLQFPETTTQRRKGLLDLIPMGGPAEQLKDSVHFVTESLTKTIQGVRDAAHNIIPEQDPTSPAYIAASAVSPLIHTFVPIETDTERGRQLQASQDALVNSGLGIAFLGRGVELKGNFKDKLGPRGEQSLIKLMNDPDIEVGSKAFESEMANIGTDLASFFVPYMGTLKLLNGVSFLSKVASKTANHKWNKAFNYSRSAVENILKQTGAISAGVSLAFDPYEDNTLAWQLAEMIDPDDDGLTKLVLDSLSVNADDSVATAYGKLIASEALIGVPLLMTGAVTRAGLTAGRNAIANRMTPEAIVELAAKMEARQIVRRTAQVKKESLDDESVNRVLSWSADDDLGFGKKAWQWTQWQSTKHLTPRGGMTHQMFELFTQAKNNERNAERFIKREVNLMDEAVEDLVYVAKEEGAGNVRGKIWNDLNDVIMDKKPVEVLHPRLQPSALKIRGTIDNLTREILSSPTIPKHDYITAEGGDVELSELVKDWAGQNNWKLDDAIEATQVLNNKNMFETLIEEGDTLVLPTLRAVMEHNLESYMRRAFKIHSAGGTLGQVAKRGIEHLIPGVTPTTRIGWTPPSRAKKETFDYLMNQANGNFDNMVDSMGIADDFVEIEKLLYNQYPRAVSRIQDELSDAFTQAREAGEEFSQEDATLAIRQRLFEDITHTRMNEILTSNAGDGSLTDTLLNQSYLFGRSMSNTGKSIFTRREDIADPILEFMGEIKDPRYRTLDTVYRMSHWIEQDKFLRKLRQIGEGVYLDTAASFNPRFTATIDMPTTALHGMKTTPEIETILSSAHNTVNQDNPLMRFVVNPMIARPKGWAQRAATTWNPMTHARNIGGSVLMHMGNGWGPTEMWPSLKEVWADLHALPEKEMDDLLRYYNSLGIIHSSVMTQQIQELVGDVGLGASFRDADSFWNHKLIQKPVKAVKLAADKVDEFYQAEDSIFKIMAFKKERDFRLGAFAEELAAGTKTRAMIDQEAANIVKNTMPNYSMIPRSIRNLRYVPFGNFFSFRFEEMRTGWNIAAQAIEELSDPRTRMRGAKRMGGFVGSVLVGGSGYTMMHNIVNNITREEEVAVRQTATDWSKGANIAITRGEDGKPSGYFDISNNMPYDAWQRWLPTLMKNISEGKYNKDSLMKSWTMAGLETIADYGQPFIQEDIYGKNILDLLFRGGRDIDGREIWAGDFLDRPIANFNTAVQHVLKSFVPGGVKSFNRIYKGFNGDFQDYYKDYNPWHDLAGTFSGFRYIPINHELTIKTNGVDFKDGMGDANAVFTSYMTTEAPEEDIYEGYDEADTLRRKAFQRMGQVVQGAMRLGATEDEIKRYLTKIDIAKKDQYALILNRYNPLPLTQDTFEKIANRSRRYRRGDMVKIQDTLKRMQSQSQTYSLLEEFPELPGPLRRWLETEKERLEEGGIRQRKAVGGVVTPTIPRASKEPDERVNKVTGVPYNQTAGIAYQDKEDRPYAPTTNP